MGEYAEDELKWEFLEYEQGEELEEEPVPSAYDVAEYQLATVFYDFKVHPEAQDQILSILKFYGEQVIREMV